MVPGRVTCSAGRRVLGSRMGFAGPSIGIWRTGPRSGPHSGGLGPAAPAARAARAARASIARAAAIP